MFKDEIKKKLKIEDEMFPFALNMLGRGKLVVSGIKRVIAAKDDSVRLKVGSESLSIVGSNLSIVEIGGGDVYVKGEIESIAFESNK